MIKKHTVLVGVVIAASLLVIATLLYPGGSLFDKNSIGFDWTKNFISNLFAAKAVNGADNPSRLWADSAMIFLSVSFALFFIQFSVKIPVRSAANVIKYLGVAAMLFTFFIVTPLHDVMINISSTLYLVSIFYITVFIFKSKLHFFKILCVICLLLFYYTLYIYGSGIYTFLPIMQKVNLFSTIILILCLHYFTRKEDFEHLHKSRL